MREQKKMKRNDPLKGLLTEDLLEVPSARFSTQLLHASMSSYRGSYSKKYRKKELPGKVIMAILIFFNLMMLVKLKPLGADSLWLIGALSVVAFMFGYGLHYLIKHFGSMKPMI